MMRLFFLSFKNLKSYNCIKLHKQNSIHILFFSTETPLCEADAIIVHDGPSAGSPAFERICKRGSNVTITSTSNQLFVIFRSTVDRRNSVNIRGFEANFVEGK